MINSNGYDEAMTEEAQWAEDTAEAVKNNFVLLWQI